MSAIRCSLYPCHAQLALEWHSDVPAENSRKGEVHVSSQGLASAKGTVTRGFIVRRLEIAAVAFAVMWAVFYQIITPFPSVDLDILMLAGRGPELDGYYYMPWGLPFYGLLSSLPYVAARIIANGLSMLGLVYAVNKLKGNKILLFTSYPFLFAVYYGQMEGVFAAALVYMLFALKRDDVIGASVAFLIAMIKIHVGVLLGLGILLMAASNNTVRFRVLAIVAAWMLVSFILWPNWVPDLMMRLIARTHDQLGFQSWLLVGPLALLLWVPFVAWYRPDYRWWAATYALTFPYYNVHYLLHLLIMPTAGVGWIAQLAYFTGYDNYDYLLLIPLLIYLICWYQAFRANPQPFHWRSRFSTHAATPQIS